MAFDQFLQFLRPYSEQYGSGNIQVDLLILCGSLSLLFMFLVVSRISANASEGNNKMTYRGFKPSAQLKQVVSELKFYIDDLSRSMQAMHDSTRDDNGYLRHEIHSIQRMIEDLHMLQERSSSNSKPRTFEAVETGSLTSRVLKEGIFLPE